SSYNFSSFYAVSAICLVSLSSSASCLSRFLVLFFFSCSFHHLDLPSFPTRRSSDLSTGPYSMITQQPLGGKAQFGGQRTVLYHRSEEHTSELQSRFDLVCRLLLEKKKTNMIYM